MLSFSLWWAILEFSKDDIFHWKVSWFMMSLLFSPMIMQVIFIYFFHIFFPYHIFLFRPPTVSQLYTTALKSSCPFKCFISIIETSRVQKVRDWNKNQNWNGLEWELEWLYTPTYLARDLNWSWKRLWILGENKDWIWEDWTFPFSSKIGIGLDFPQPNRWNGVGPYVSPFSN